MKTAVLHWYNPPMRKTGLLFLSFFIFAWFSSACEPIPELSAITPSPSLVGTLRPYPSDTPSATPLPTDYVSPTPSPTITPSPTPVYYEVQLGDDMYSIAWRYDVSPEALMTANPTVNPRAMSVGMTLLIPITPMPEVTGTATQTSAVTQTSNPPYGNLREPNCYFDALGGAWCFALVQNETPGAVENVSGMITLDWGEDEDIRQEAAITPLNLLPSGKTLPLIAYFQPPIPEGFRAFAEVEFYLPVMEEDSRYLQTEIQQLAMDLDNNGLIAEVSGEVYLLDDQPDAEYLWLFATAFDAEGNIVAVRRWDHGTQLNAGKTLPFDLTLYSLGSAIDRIEVLVEAQSVEYDADFE